MLRQKLSTLYRSAVVLRNDERGTVFTEFTIAFILYAILLVFILDAGVALYHFSTVADRTTALTRHLAADLGRSWNIGKVNQAPWNGSCNEYLRDVGEDFLASMPGEFSMHNSSGTYYFGATLDDSNALVMHPDVPYAILRISGRVQPPYFVRTFAAGTIFASESSMLVEFHSEKCNDY